MAQAPVQLRDVLAGRRQLGRGVLGHRRHRTRVAGTSPARRVPTALVYSIVNVVLVCGVVALSTGQRFRDVIHVGSRDRAVVGVIAFALVEIDHGDEAEFLRLLLECRHRRAVDRFGELAKTGLGRPLRIKPFKGQLGKARQLRAVPAPRFRVRRALAPRSRSCPWWRAAESGRFSLGRVL